MRPVFIHVSKNGGTSIVRSGGDQIVNAGHRTAASWVAEHGRSAPMFAVVRHPYDRVASEYAYRRRRLDAGERNPHLEPAAQPFDAWVIATLLGGVFRTADFFRRTGEPHRPENMVDGTMIWFLPQTRWLSDTDGNLLVDDVLRFETLARDWARFAGEHGIESTLVHANASSRSAGLRASLDARLKRVIYTHYRDDFEAFDFDP